MTVRRVKTTRSSVPEQITTPDGWTRRYTSLNCLCCSTSLMASTSRPTSSLYYSWEGPVTVRRVKTTRSSVPEQIATPDGWTRRSTSLNCLCCSTSLMASTSRPMSSLYYPWEGPLTVRRATNTRSSVPEQITTPDRWTRRSTSQNCLCCSTSSMADQWIKLTRWHSSWSSSSSRHGSFFLLLSLPWRMT